MNRVILSPEYFPNPTIGRPISSADIYIGIVDLDPEIEANQKQVSVQQENGVIVEVTQPIHTGAGGVPLYNGSPVTILVEGDYSLKVLDKNGAQLYYVPEQFSSTSNADDITYTPPFTGGVDRTQEDKNADILNVKDFGAVGDGATDDTTAVTAAVNAADVDGKTLYWADGTYLTTASIPSFHSVRHTGDGLVQRDSDLFAVEPEATKNNILYVATAGLSINDGLASSTPMLLIQDAFDALVNYGPILNGAWVVDVAAGEYTTFGSSTRIAELKAGLRSLNLITVRGPAVGHPNEPTVFLGPSGSTQISGNGLFITNASKLLVKDIKIRNLNGLGLSGDRQCQLRTENVHTFNIGRYGISITALGDLEVKGGILDGFDQTNDGIRSLFLCRHTVGDQLGADTINGPIMKNFANGIIAQEGATGHSDYVTYEDNVIAVRAAVNARVNVTGSDFKRNTVAMRADTGGIIFDQDVVLNTETADANTENYRNQSSGLQAIDAIYNTESVADLNFDTFSTAANTTEQNAKVYNMEADKWGSVPGSIYLGKAIKVRAAGNIVGTAGVKEFRIRIFGLLVGGITTLLDSNGGFVFESTIYLTSSTTQKSITKLETQLGSERTEVDYSVSAIGTERNIDISLVMTIQLGNSADAVNVETWEVEVQG